MRVRKGGFHVTTPLAIENNYWGNMEMLEKNFTMFDSVEIIDTSNLIIPIVKLEFGNIISVIATSQIPEWLKKGMPGIFGMITALKDEN